MIRKFLNLGNQPLANSYLFKKQLNKKEKKFKLELVFNDKNFLVSINKKISTQEMFNSHYPYRSSMSNTMLKSFKNISTMIKKRFNPKFMINLATLTGAIIISLGNEYAGLFSNNNQLAERINKVGYKDNEKAWRLPLNKNFDALIDSQIADVQNINYSGGAGSITAAQFLQRFVLNKTPWAHLDIAGMAFSKYGGALNAGGATGYGVRLLNQLVEDHYE